MWGRLTNAQGKFLRVLMVHKGSVEEVAAEVGTPMHKVEAWMGQATFRRELCRRMRGMDRLRELDVKRGAGEAARRLSRAAFGLGDFTKKNLYERRACVDLIQLARAWERERRLAREVKVGEGASAAASASAPADAKGMSERERVYSINGEKGLEAYDRFVKLHEQRRQAGQEGQSPQEGGVGGTGY